MKGELLLETCDAPLKSTFLDTPTPMSAAEKVIALWVDPQTNRSLIYAQIS